MNIHGVTMLEGENCSKNDPDAVHILRQLSASQVHIVEFR